MTTIALAADTMAPAEAPAPPDIGRLAASEQASLLRIAVRLLDEPEEARDLVQATLADAQEHRRTLRDATCARAWLRQILVRRALNHRRRRRVWNAARAVLGFEPRPVAATPDSLFGRARRLEALSRALDRLPPRQAGAFTLRYLEGLDVDAVARALGVGRGTARTHLRRAVQALRGVLLSADGGER